MTLRRHFLATLCSFLLLSSACGEGSSAPPGGGGATSAGGEGQGALTSGGDGAAAGTSNGNASVGANAGTGGDGAFAGPLSVGRMRTEYRENPLGLDVTEPRLEWLLTSELKDEKQTAYRVLVATSPELLAQGQGDLWDSGQVESEASIQVVYGGAPLVSRQRAHWKVRVWDKDGLPAAWSAPAFWEMGLR